MKTYIMAGILALSTILLAYFNIIDYGCAWIAIVICLLALPQRHAQSKVEHAAKYKDESARRFVR